MKITSVELHPAGSTDVAVLSFRDPARANPFNIKTMTGLDASDGIVPQFYGKSGSSSAAFYNLSIQKRNVAMTIALNPQFTLNKSYSDLRDELYKMISSSRTGLIEIQFKNGATVVAVTSGFVTKAEANLFEKLPTVVLTFSAVDPMLKAPDPVAVAVAGLDLSNFPVSDTESTAPHGFIFDANINVEFASLVITDPNDSSWSFGVTPNGGFLIGDVLHFSSDPKSKALYISRGVNTIYLADVIDAGSMWPIMFPGDNHFAFTNPTDLALTDFSYYPTFWGV